MKAAIFFFLSRYLIFCDKYQFANSLLGKTIRTAEEFEYPFVVFITVVPDRYVDRNISYFCTGSLITIKDVLTSEVCLQNRQPEDIQIHAGSYELNKTRVYYPAWWVHYPTWAMHKNIRVEYSGIELTIIRLTENTTNTNPGLVLSLTKAELAEKDAVIASWGKLNDGTMPTFLQVGAVQMLSKRSCERRYHKFTKNHTYIHDAIICSARRRPYTIVTDGDSGSPVIFSNRIIAVTKGATPVLPPGRSFDRSQLNIHYVTGFFQDFIFDVAINCT